MGVPLQISTDIVDIPVPGMFASSDWRVINCDGDNFYKACGQPVRDKPEGGETTCVKPVYHPSSDHEDFDGCTRFETFTPETIEYKTRDHLRKVLRAVGLDDDDVYNVQNALTAEGFRVTRGAAQWTMI